ncbi:hypothetical protein ZIOFF_039666 [Zingiber officinale]|uniref:TRF2/HOY1 PH-like domain-containing protein n=1 Tax=Zingiber officinale TaxID=94328 RepID=A0A8J5G8L3_ZINOF|nr:hypothetical protein ZIOFF_039666 [Zingiber officinale]
MVWSLDSSKRRADSTPNSAPPPPAMKLEVEEPLDEKHVRLHKRARDVSTSYEKALYNNVLREPGPLGLLPRKSPYEGDLVAKCYLAKHKLVWEVLEGGLKSKIEFYWSDITAIKAVFFEEAAELGVLGFLLWISSGGMVWSLDSSKRRADSTPHSAPPPPAMKLEVEEPLDEKHVRLHKRARDVSTSYEQALYNNVLGELGPYEGDLVAKCYLAKHKLVREVLEGGLKHKTEFYWSDITAIKAVIFDHKSCGEVAELGVLGFLLWISSDGMVWSLDSSKRRADSTLHSAPPPPAMKLEVEEPLDEKHVRLHKRVRDVSTSYEQTLYNNVLRELGSLGLRPRKSPSLADMI